MDTHSFMDSLTSVVRLSPEEPFPYEDNSIVFSMADNLDKIVVTTTPEMYDSFVDSPPSVRAVIMQDVFRRF